MSTRMRLYGKRILDRHRQGHVIRRVRNDASTTIMVRTWCDGCMTCGHWPMSNGIVAGPDRLDRVAMPLDRRIRVNRAPVGWLPIGPGQQICPACSVPFLLLATTLC